MWDLSTSELEQAWRHVFENAGCAGADGVTVEHFAYHGASGLAQLASEVLDGDYRCLPLLQIVVEKKSHPGGRREFLVPTVRDRVVQTAVARRLSKSFEEEFLDSSYAYRPGRSVDRAIARITQWRDRGCSFLVDADISGFFDNVSHPVLLERLAADPDARDALPLLEQWIRAWYWDGRRLHKLRRGVAQGSPISPLLANYFLSDFDRQMEASQVRLVRYADDFVLLCTSLEEAQNVMESVREELRRLSLELNPAKTQIRTFDEGFSFLGAFFLKDKVFTPWKRDRARGKVLFMAHKMPQSLLDRFRERKRGRPAARRRSPVALEQQQQQPQQESRNPGEMGVSFSISDEQGSILRKSGDRLIVEAGDRVILDLPYHKLEAVLVFGNVQITSQAMGEILEKGVRVSFFTRHGRFLGAGVAATGKNVTLRVRQFQAYAGPDRALALAREIVKQKIANSAAVLEYWAEHNPATLKSGWRSDFDDACTACGTAQTIAMLDGIEGAAAHAYFEQVMKFNKSAFQWKGRHKHPATDPLNGMMSLVYTLLTHELTGLLDGVGLDPYLGFLHQLDYGRPSLALDLIEAFRSVVADHLVLRTVNLGIIGEKDFHQEEETGQALMTSEAAKRFFAEYEKWMLEPRGAKSLTFRQVLRADVERLASALEDNTPWHPFRVEKASDAKVGGNLEKT